MIKRESGIDILRCLALLFVNGVHGFLYNGFYNEKQIGILMWGADSARWLFYCCNALFMLLPRFRLSHIHDRQPGSHGRNCKVG